MTDSPSMTRTEALLATIVVQNMGAASQADKCVALSRIGLNNGDIADVLGTTTAVVSQSLYAARKANKRPKKAAAKKAIAKSAKKTTVKKAAGTKKAVGAKKASQKTSATKSSSAKSPAPSVLRGVRRG